MPTPILMPKLGDIMTEGTVAKWLKAPGQTVEKGEPLMEVSTEKITFEVPAVEAGILHPVLAEGQVAPVGGLVGYLLAPGEAPPGGAVGAPVPPPSQARVETTAGPSSVPPSVGAGFKPAPTAPGEADRRIAEGPVRATPAARRLAKEMGVDIEILTGTGPGGRVSEDDVRRAAAAQPSVGAGLKPAPTSMGEGVAIPSPRGRGKGEGREPPFVAIPLAGIRKLIAQRMHQSIQASAQLSFALEVDATELVAARRQYLREHRPSPSPPPSPKAGEGVLAPSPTGRGEGEGAGPVRLTYTHLIIKAAAEALRRYPALNAAIVGDEVHRYQQVNIGFALALDEGLMVPVVRDAGAKTVEEIGRAVEELIERSKANRLTLDDLSGGTFTVSVLGTVDSFTPILNPPEVALLGVGRFVDKPAIFKGEIAKRTMVTLSLTVDHRAIDGAPAAAFLRRLRQLIESPAALFGAAPLVEEQSEEE